MSAHLKLNSNSENKDIPCHAVITIGRDKNSDIRINDRQVSRNHAMVRRLGEDDYYLIDSGSANGSAINNRRITTPTLLKNNDLISIGSATIQFIQHKESHPQAVEQADEDELEATIFKHEVNIQQLTILVADIRGFTTLSEQIPIATLTKIMSEWFRHVSNLIAENEGIVDKFIGDCVYARWEASEDVPNTVINALNSAVAINKISSTLSQAYPELPDKLKIGVGINTGPASVGIGSDNTAIGDAVNLAFRLESATKEVNKDVVLNQSAYQDLPAALWQHKEKEIMVKGKKEPVKICGLNFDEIEAFLSNVKS